MSFTQLFIVFCIFYTLCRFLYKYHSARTTQEPTSGPEFLKSLGENACGIIFKNNTGKSLSLKITGTQATSTSWTEHFTLGPEGGKLAFFSGTQLKIALSDENYIDIGPTESLKEYTITIHPDYSLNAEQN